MPGILKQFKIETLSKGRFGRYLLYAIGEIVLVVLGILIALSIKNHHEEKAQKAQLAGILTNVREDLKEDTIAINTALAYYAAREETAINIITDAYGEAEYKKCALCPSLLTFYYPFSLNTKGYEELETFYKGVQQKDSLAMDITQFYKIMPPNVTIVNEQIKVSAIKTTEHWRDNYPWFSQLIGGTQTSGFFQYMESSDFKNRVAYNYTITCKSLPAILRQYKYEAKKLLVSID